MRETNDKTQMLCSHSTTDLSPHLAKPDKNKLTSIVERMSHINISNYSNIMETNANKLKEINAKETELHKKP